MTTYETIIGLEIHAELMTNSKMFCRCKVVDSVEAPPNTAVCPVCLGMPGMLPVINRRAVEFSMRVALALNCDIQHHNIFARKNFFYPDLPKAYQLSQYELPIGLNGWLDIDLEDGSTKRIRIRRAHMEEDTGKQTHLDRTADATEEGTLVDYNRSGVPLLEIVSEPDISNGEEARAYAMKIRQIVRYLGVNTGDLEKGVFRVEPNISLRPVGTTKFGTRTELKNLNSFKVLTDGTAYEIKRQTEVLEGGGRVVQETRGWNDAKRVTFSQRSKEEAEDYRYFPEPDLPPLSISDEWIAEVKASLPELPDAKVARYQSDYGLSAYDSQVLTEERAVAEWFEAAIEAGGQPKPIANWMINNLFSLMNEHKQSIDEIQMTPAALVALVDLVEKRTINNNTGKEVLAEMFSTGQSAQAIVEAKSLAQISDDSAIAVMIEQVLADNPDKVTAYLGGQEKLRGFFMGQVMQKSQGKADPAVVNRLLSEALAARKAE